MALVVPEMSTWLIVKCVYLLQSMYVSSQIFIYVATLLFTFPSLWESHPSNLMMLCSILLSMVVIICIIDLKNNTFKKNICSTHSITIPSIGKPCATLLAFMLVLHKFLYKMFENFHDCQTCQLLNFYETWYQLCSVIQSFVFVQCQQVKKARNNYWTIVFVTCMIIYMWKYRPVLTNQGGCTL